MDSRLEQLLILALLTLWLPTSSWALHIDVSPKVVHQLVTDQVSVSCLANDSPFWSHSVILMSIGKTGQNPLATLGQGNTIQYGADRTSNLEAEGLIDKNSSESFLRLVIKKPGYQDAGSYSCQMHYLNGHGVLKQGTALANLTINNNDKTVFIHLLKAVSTLEKFAEEKSNKMAEQEMKLKKQDKMISDLSKQFKNQQGRMKELETEDANLQTKFSDLKKTTAEERTKLENQDQLISDQANKLSQQKGQLDLLNKNDANLQAKFSDMKRTAAEEKTKLETQTNKLKHQQQLISDQAKELSQQKDQLDLLNKNDAKKKSELSNLTKQVSDLRNVVATQKKSIASQESKLKHQEKRITDQGELIKAQGSRITNYHYRRDYSGGSDRGPILPSPSNQVFKN